MDLWKTVEMLNERYPTDGRDPLEECRRIKEEISKESVGLSYEELMKYYGDCGVDGSDGYCEVAEEVGAYR